MALHTLPQELLEKIIGHLDTGSWMALGTLKPIFSESTNRFAENLKLKSFTPHMREYFRLNGSAVKSLNLNNSVTPSNILSELIGNCPNITDLRLTGTRLSSEEILQIIEKLENLQTLSMSVSVPDDRSSAGPARRRFALRHSLMGQNSPRLKQLYLETLNNMESLDLSLDIMNQCTALETVYINIIWNRAAKDAGASELLPERWNTLRTVVISILDTDIPWSRGMNWESFVKRVFKHRFGEQADKIYYTPDTYIYENGYFNRMTLSADAVHQGADLLEKMQVHPRRAADAENVLPPWGSPQKLRIIENVEEEFDPPRYIPLPASLGSELVELDFTDNHATGSAKAEYLAIIVNSPKLEALAIPPCNLYVPTVPSSAEFLDRVLPQTRLKRFCLKQNVVDRCKECDENFLKPRDLPNLTNLIYLEEINLNKVTIETSACVLLNNPKVRTMKICLSSYCSYEHVSSLLNGCRNLRILKLEGFLVPLETPRLWQSLARCENVRQLCLGSWNECSDPSGIPEMRTPRMRLSDNVATAFFGNLHQLIARLDVFHLHNTILVRLRTLPRVQVKLHCYIRKHMELNVDPRRETIAERFVGPEESSLAFLHMRDEIPVFPGRPLCNPESFIGRFVPEGWSME